MVLRDTTTGAFEAYSYSVANNALSGPLLWARSAWIGSSAASPRDAPTAPAGGFGWLKPLSSCKRWAVFGGGSGAAETVNATPLGADTSQQPLLDDTAARVTRISVPSRRRPAESMTTRRTLA